MAKYSDLFLEEGELNDNVGARKLNLGHKGFFGQLPAIGGVIDGKNYDAYLSSAPYVSQPVIAKVISTPGFMNLLPGAKAWQKAFVSFIEEHPTKITGLNSTITVDTESNEVGGTGEQQEAPRRIKRTRTVITLEMPEKLHKSASSFAGDCIRYGQGNEYTGVPLASLFIENLDDVGGGWTPDLYSANVVFMEPDVTKLDIVDVWYGVQFFFKTSGDRTAKRDLASGGDTQSLSIECAGIFFGTAKAFEFARQLLPKISNIRANPDVAMELPNEGIDADIADL